MWMFRSLGKLIHSPYRQRPWSKSRKGQRSDLTDHHNSCGLNGALYFVSMDEDGGLSKYSGNKAGAKYGTGYCDAQCPRDLKFINGEANVGEWKESTNDPNAGVGKYGSCCTEMDIWFVATPSSISPLTSLHPTDNP